MPKNALSQTESAIGQELARLLKFDTRITQLERKHVELDRQMLDFLGDCLPTDLGSDSLMFRTYDEEGPKHFIITARPATAEEAAQWGGAQSR